MATMATLAASSAAAALTKAQQQDWRSCPANAVRLVANAGVRQESWSSSLGRRALGVRCEGGQKVGFLGRLGRVIKEKAKSDIQLLFSGFSKTRENLAVVDELLTYWNLDESENILDELEEVSFSCQSNVYSHPLVSSQFDFVSSELSHLSFGDSLHCEFQAGVDFFVSDCQRAREGEGEIIIACWRAFALDRRCLYPTLVPRLL